MFTQEVIDLAYVICGMGEDEDFVRVHEALHAKYGIGLEDLEKIASSLIPLCKSGVSDDAMVRTGFAVNDRWIMSKPVGEAQVNPPINIRNCVPYARLGEVTLFTSEDMVELNQVKQSRWSRLKAKLRGRDDPPAKGILWTDNAIVCHPKNADELLAELKNKDFNNGKIKLPPR